MTGVQSTFPPSIPFLYLASFVRLLGNWETFAFFRTNELKDQVFWAVPSFLPHSFPLSHDQKKKKEPSFLSFSLNHHRHPFYLSPYPPSHTTLSSIHCMTFTMCTSIIRQFSHLNSSNRLQILTDSIDQRNVQQHQCQKAVTFVCVPS